MPDRKYVTRNHAIAMLGVTQVVFLRFEADGLLKPRKYKGRMRFLAQEVHACRPLIAEVEARVRNDEPVSMSAAVLSALAGIDIP